MRVFLTGATGFIGSAIVANLLDDGHEVLGLVRSETSADALRQAGCDVLRGDLRDLESLRRRAAAQSANRACRSLKSQRPAGPGTRSARWAA